MTSILLSRQPQIAADVLNENSKLLVCKKFPKDYVGWVYIYCTKGNNDLYKDLHNLGGSKYYLYDKNKPFDYELKSLNGKVVARFWCDKVEVIHYSFNIYEYMTKTLKEVDLVKNSCMGPFTLTNYLEDKDGYAIHISKLEVFDKPLYLDDFTRPAKCKHCKECEHKNNKICDKGFVKMFDKAPTNYCYIEGEN